jgi:hypothetical protein
MSHRSQQVGRMVAAFLVITLFQVYVLADAVRPNASAEPAGLVYGKLSLPGNRAILINGNNATSGTTILSGAQLQTPEGTEATVLLGPAGHLYIAPNSELTLTFDKTSVDVLVRKGNAVLSTNAGVAGTVRDADGKVLSTVDPANTGATAGKPASAAAKTTTEEKAALIIIPIVIAAIIVAVAASNGNDNENVSPTTPSL